MIIISGNQVQPGALSQQWSLNTLQKEIMEKMARSEGEYRFDSPQILKFELELRRNILTGAEALYRSGARFATFEHSRCDPQYWQRTKPGGFLLKQGIRPSAAIQDIFINGEEYAFECATAIPIVYYGAVLESLGVPTFNRLFPGLYLYSWNHDSDLDLETYIPDDYFPADVRYFKNPEVDPETIEWQGINAIVLGDGQYYGHGVGVRSSREMIAILNEHRRPDAVKSAYLMESVTRPDFKRMYPYSITRSIGTDERKHQPVTVRIGGRTT